MKIFLMMVTFTLLASGCATSGSLKHCDESLPEVQQVDCQESSSADRFYGGRAGL